MPGVARTGARGAIEHGRGVEFLSASAESLFGQTSTVELTRHGGQYIAVVQLSVARTDTDGEACARVLTLAAAERGHRVPSTAWRP